MEGPDADFPDDAILQDSLIPYHFLADGGFGLTERILTPFTQTSSNTQERIYFNYRLSRYLFRFIQHLKFRARSVIDGSFGMLVNRFKLLKVLMDFDVSTCTKLLMSGILLHNFLLKYGEIELPDEDEQTQEDRPDEGDDEGNLNNPRAIEIRNKFVDYFSS